MFPIFFRAFLMVPCPHGQGNKFLVIFVHCRVLAFNVTTFASPLVGHFFSFSFRVLAINDLAWMLAVFSLISPPPDHIYPSGGFSSNKIN